MYEEFYQLEKPPFRMTPDPEFLYLSPSHQEALAAIVYGVEQRKGFVVVVGEVGLGKTTILRCYLAQHDPKRLSIAYIFYANLTFKGLLETIFRELSIEDRPDDVVGMVNRLHDVFIEEYRQGRNVVLVVDEAQNMPIDTLENLRVLSNLETFTDKLVQIVLVGQPEFAETLNVRELRQFRQRIAVRSTLSPLTDEESQAYIEFRLSKAGSSSSSVFTRGALREIVKRSGGIPRMLNILCDSALITGLGYQKKPVTVAIVHEIIGDLEGKIRAAGHLWVRVSLAALAALAVASVVLLVSPFWGFLQPGRDTARQIRNSPPAPTRPATGPSREPSPLPLPGDEGNRAEASRPVVDAAARQPAERPLVATRVVKKGDTLNRLAANVYGFVTAEVLQRIVKHNPGIGDGNRILVGTAIRFPDVSDLQPTRPRSPLRERQKS